ncbi:hypothetical protein F5Y05DRAFT_415709 [Hypoxylon sp. FL0543]|nr:hypothetical protein F5Y05DRAFT_415709 [Hypoxylon sp. FL0543]
MCKRYMITYSCGCTKPQDAPCAESPNSMGNCSEGIKPKYSTNDGPHICYSPTTRMVGHMDGRRTFGAGWKSVLRAIASIPQFFYVISL